MALSIRQMDIVNLAKASGRVEVDDLASRFDVSVQTIRRDLNMLAGRSMLSRVHGGAVAAGPTTLEPRFTAKSTLNLEAKRRIGQAAAAMVRPGDSLALSAGTTTLALAQALTELGIPTTELERASSAGAAAGHLGRSDPGRAAHPPPRHPVAAGDDAAGVVARGDELPRARFRAGAGRQPAARPGSRTGRAGS